MRLVLTLVLSAGCLPLAWGQASPVPQKPAAQLSQYSGGGIRGATEIVPDGWLVSPAEAIEFKGEDAYREPPSLRPRAVVPQIDILKPEAAEEVKVKSPFQITVVFKGQTDAPIDPGTFKVLYGALKLDITSRITKFIKVTSNGFVLDKAQIPPGKHRLTLQVQDSKQRTAERELRFEVEEPAK